MAQNITLRFSAHWIGEDGLLDLRCETRSSAQEKPVIQAKLSFPVTLEIIQESETEVRQL
jgi:hypothetical protein